MKLLIGMLLCLGAGFGLCAQGTVGTTNKKESTPTTEDCVASLIRMANESKPPQGDTSGKFYQSLSYADQAINLSTRNKLYRELYNASILKLDILLNAGKIHGMEKMLMTARNDSLKAEITRAISRYYNDAKFEPRNFPKAIQFATQSLEISISLNDRNRQINANNQLGYIYIIKKDLAKAEEHFLRVTKFDHQVKSDNIGFAYYYIIGINDRRGYFNRALKFGLDALKYLERPGYDPYALDIYQNLGRVYANLEDYDNSLIYLNRSLNGAAANADAGTYWYFNINKTLVLLKTNRPREALQNIQETLKILPPDKVFSRVYVHLMLGKVYTALKEFDNAEKNLLEADKLNNGPDVSFSINKNLADLYYAMGKMELSKIYLDKVINSPDYWTELNIAASYLLRFQIDSTLGDFQSALYYLQKHKLLNDSINALSRSRQIEELKMQYQNEKIIQDVTLKQQKILLLENQKKLQSREFEQSRLQFLLDSKDKENNLLLLNAETAQKDKNLQLNKQRIAQLQTDNENRLASLRNANLVRNITVGFIILLALVLLLLYKQYRAKQAASKIISSKNVELEELVSEKENLLLEKDWLLKEVHHRVKNNLQTVVSLLESQSVYLNNKALEANLDSRNRVYAMSLVHQKLYQTDNVASIQMDVYLSELVNHLRDSMDISGIYFKQQLAAVKLDVSQAIILGLILNETITNAIKHAFPKQFKDPVVEITLSQQEDGRLCLVCKDNGIGIPANVSTTKPSSLGLKLIKGLTGDIMGDFEMYADKGTIIKISFLPQDTLPALHKKEGQPDEISQPV